MKAVISIQGHQYIVAEGDTLVVDRFAEKEGEVLTFDTVLLVFDDKGESVLVGSPYLAEKSVIARVVEHKRGNKIRVFKFQGKKRYHKTRGFKSSQTILSIEKINA